MKPETGTTIPSFSQIDIRLIQALLHSKTDTEIAAILERDVEDVTLKINELASGRAVRNKQINDIEEKREKEKPKQKKAISRKVKVLPVKSEKFFNPSYDKNERALSRKKQEEVKRLKTLTVDLAKLIPYKLDYKTTIFIKPWADIEKVKKQYKKLLSIPIQD